jgi:hypothetical protein
VEGSLKELAFYRMERAKEMLVASEENLKMRQYRTSCKIIVLNENIYPESTLAGSGYS